MDIYTYVQSLKVSMRTIDRGTRHRRTIDLPSEKTDSRGRLLLRANYISLAIRLAPSSGRLLAIGRQWHAGHACVSAAPAARWLKCRIGPPRGDVRTCAHAHAPRAARPRRPAGRARALARRLGSSMHAHVACLTNRVTRDHQTHVQSNEHR
jgi:hypothetical protein